MTRPNKAALKLLLLVRQQSAEVLIASRTMCIVAELEASKNGRVACGRAMYEELGASCPSYEGTSSYIAPPVHLHWHQTVLLINCSSGVLVFIWWTEIVVNYWCAMCRNWWNCWYGGFVLCRLNCSGQLLTTGITATGDWCKCAPGGTIKFVRTLYNTCGAGDLVNWWCPTGWAGVGSYLLLPPLVNMVMGRVIIVHIASSSLS